MTLIRLHSKSFCLWNIRAGIGIRSGNSTLFCENLSFGGMKLLVVGLLVLTAQCLASRGSSRQPAEYDMRLYEHLKLRLDSNPCKQDVPNCTECSRKKSCTWCSSTDEPSGVCKASRNCASSRKITCQEENNFEDDLEDQLQDMNQVNRSYILDVKEATLNASYLCHLKRNCSDCTTLEFCAWCQAKGACIVYSGASTTETCGSKSWYKNQCTYSGKFVYSRVALPIKTRKSYSTKL